MKELSDKTNGIQIVVNEVQEIIHWEGKLQAIVKLGEKGDFSFGELIAKCHIPGCACALHQFVSSRISSQAATLDSLITKYAGKGLEEWALLTRQGATLSQTASVLDEQFIMGVDTEAAENKQFSTVVASHIGTPGLVPLDGPLMLSTLISMRGIVLSDFAWAGLDETCADLNDREQLQSLLQSGMVITNLYDRPIR
jgi:hypothetical protein